MDRGRLNGMRLSFLLVTALLAAPVASAQTPAASSSASGSSPAQDIRPVPPVQEVQPAGPSDLPVSLAHIREGLKREARESLLLKAEIPADFRVHVIEQQKIDELLSKLDFKSLRSSPAPAGGLYGYEQQRRLFNPVDHPLVQPYAAFSGGELITIAIENLIARYLGGKVTSGLAGAEHDRAQRAAREEVDREVAAYCATRPDRAAIALCTLPSDR